MTQTIGEVTKQKFHNFVVFCGSIEHISQEAKGKLDDLDKQSAMILLSIFREYVSPHMEQIKQRDISAMAWCIPSGVMLDHGQIDRLCNYFELFDHLAQQTNK